MDFSIKAGKHFRRGNTKPRLYKAASTQLVWTAHISRTNRNKPRFNVLTTNGLVHAMHEATASGQCAVHTTSAEAASYGLRIFFPEVCNHLKPPEAIPLSDSPGNFFSIRFLTRSASGHTRVSQTVFFFHFY